MIVDDAGLETNKASVGIGVSGWDGSSENIFHEVTKTESWQDIDFTFTTGESLGTAQSIYFNAGPGYIDNWEMYELSDVTSVSVIEDGEISVYPTYSSNNFTIRTNGENGMITVYDMIGKVILERKIENSREMITIQGEGMYLINVKCDQDSATFKVFRIR